MLSSILVAGLIVATPKAPAPISTAEVTRTLTVIAGPALKGRMTASPSMYACADWLVKEYTSYGKLQPAGSVGWFHDFEVTVNQRATKNNFATFMAGDKKWSLELGKDYVPLTNSVFRIASGEVVFFGSGAPDSSVKGKIAMMYRANPGATPQTSIGSRTNAAVAAGATGIIWVGRSKDGMLDLPVLTRSNGFGRGTSSVGIAITSAAFEKLTGLKSGFEPAAGGQLLNLKARMVAETEPNRTKGRNVIAMLPGTDPKLKDEIIVVGGHFDHLGHGETGSRSGTDQLHLGADDNGSGTSAVLAMAKWFAQNGGNRRTILFQNYSGEELGLLGAAAWVRDNRDKWPKIQAMINLDMVGRLRNEALTVFCVSSANEFNGMIDSISIPGIKPTKVMSAPGNSDHGPFLAAGIPALFLHTGLHEEYHTEKDVLSTINFEGLALSANFGVELVKKIDAVDSKLAFVRAEASQGSGNSGGAGAGRRVRTGFIPDMSAEVKGVLITGTTGGSPAEKAGVKPGDILIRFDGKTVASLEDLQKVLGEAKPDVTVKIVVLRNGAEVELSITPTAATAG